MYSAEHDSLLRRDQSLFQKSDMHYTFAGDADQSTGTLGDPVFRHSSRGGADGQSCLGTGGATYDGPLPVIDRSADCAHRSPASSTLLSGAISRYFTLEGSELFEWAPFLFKPLVNQLWVLLTRFSCETVTVAIQKRQCCQTLPS